MPPPDIAVRGIRGPIPPGYVLGRQSAGMGPPELISLASLTTPLQNQVTSVFGRKGAVVATTGDYTVGQVTNAMSDIGTITNDDAAAGHIGEYMASNIVFASRVTLTSTVKANLTSLPLTAGDWDMTGTFSFSGDAATTVANLTAGISETSAVFTTTYGSPINFPCYNNQPFNGFGGVKFAVNPSRVSLAAPATIYAVVQANFAVGACYCSGLVSARRVR